MRTVLQNCSIQLARSKRNPDGVLVWAKFTVPKDTFTQIVEDALEHLKCAASQNIYKQSEAVIIVNDS